MTPYHCRIEIKSEKFYLGYRSREFYIRCTLIELGSKEVAPSDVFMEMCVLLMQGEPIRFYWYSSTHLTELFNQELIIRNVNNYSSVNAQLLNLLFSGVIDEHLLST